MTSAGTPSPRSSGHCRATRSELPSPRGRLRIVHPWTDSVEPESSSHRFEPRVSAQRPRGAASRLEATWRRPAQPRGNRIIANPNRSVLRSGPRTAVAVATSTGLTSPVGQPQNAPPIAIESHDRAPHRRTPQTQHETKAAGPRRRRARPGKRPPTRSNVPPAIMSSAIDNRDASAPPRRKLAIRGGAPSGGRRSWTDGRGQGTLCRRRTPRSEVGFLLTCKPCPTCRSIRHPESRLEFIEPSNGAWSGAARAATERYCRRWTA